MMDFKLPYNRARYISFLKTQLLPEDFADSEERITPSFQPQFIQNIVKIGEAPSLDLSVYEVEHPSENDPRVSLSRDTFRLMAKYGKKRALVFLISKSSRNYRLSLVTIDLKWEKDNRVQKEYSNPRRYSFFLGPDTKTHTPEEYLVKQGRIKDFEDLKKRFSIEVVNKEFYAQIAVLFTQLAGGKREIGRKSIDAGIGNLKLPSTNDDILRKEFTVRLIGRLVFSWFLKKKRSEKGVTLISEDILSVKAVKLTKGYYHQVLEPLFFEILNTPVEQRDKKHICSPWEQTPFLNGGLFNPHAHDFYDPGALGISKHINTLRIPDNWFEELFTIFETYNFTIDENTSVDVELSIEPEMLGRIFENLLAEINPTTGETARKATGSYYTPRPIVEYMIDESLKQYLVAKTNLSEEKVSALLTYENTDTDISENERDIVIEALDTIKIIDPACGSGAFPMGILQKMLLVLQKVDPDSQNWLGRKLSSIGDVVLRNELKSKLRADNFNYIHKIGIIRDAIYGVDIQPIAIEISKLRFFLSLIVDEKVDDTKENRGIEPLPNLEFKFICANSLIGLPKKASGHIGILLSQQQSLFDEDGQRDWSEAEEDIQILRGLRDNYLRSFGNEKKKIEKKFQDVQSLMFKHSLNWGGQNSQTLKLSQWNPFTEEPCSWFDPDWMFGVKHGFDIVLGNPPWEKVKPQDPEFFSIFDAGYREFSKINQQKIKETFLQDNSIKNAYDNFVSARYEVMEYASKNYLLQGSSDLNYYKLFLEKSLVLSRLVICWILPGSLTIDEGSLSLRKHLIESNLIRELLGFSNKEGIFEWVDNNQKFMVITIKKDTKNKSFSIYGWLTSAENLNKVNKISVKNDFYKNLDPSNVTLFLDSCKKSFTLMESLQSNIRIKTLRDIGPNYWSEYHATNDANYFNEKTGKILLFSGKVIDQFDCMAKRWIEKHGRSSKWESLGFPKDLSKFRTEYYVNRVPERIRDHHNEEKSKFRVVIQNVTGTINNIRTVYACALHKRHLTNNSLHNLYIGKNDRELFYYLGIINSFCLDWQARIKVATNLNKFILESFLLPSYDDANEQIREEVADISFWLSKVCSDFDELQNVFSKRTYKSREEAIVRLNGLVATLYGFDKKDIEFILTYFQLTEDSLKRKILEAMSIGNPMTTVL